MIIIQIIDSNTVVVTTSDELKQVISEDNNYDYIYLGNDITATSGFVINGNKSKVIIDGTYNNTKYTYTNNLSLEADVIKVSTTNKRIILKNMVIRSSMKIVFRPLKINFTGTLDNRIIPARNIVATAYPAKVWNKNTDTINPMVPTSLVLGSSL